MTGGRAILGAWNRARKGRQSAAQARPVGKQRRLVPSTRRQGGVQALRPKQQRHPSGHQHGTPFPSHQSDLEKARRQHRGGKGWKEDGWNKGIAVRPLGGKPQQGSHFAGQGSQQQDGVVAR